MGIALPTPFLSTSAKRRAKRRSQTKVSMCAGSALGIHKVLKPCKKRRKTLTFKSHPIECSEQSQQASSSSFEVTGGPVDPALLCKCADVKDWNALACPDGISSKQLSKITWSQRPCPPRLSPAKQRTTCLERRFPTEIRRLNCFEAKRKPNETASRMPRGDSTRHGLQRSPPPFPCALSAAGAATTSPSQPLTSRAWKTGGTSPVCKAVRPPVPEPDPYQFLFGAKTYGRCQPELQAESRLTWSRHLQPIPSPCR